MLCERPKREGLVLDEFDYATHVVRSNVWEQCDATSTQRWLYGMDFGFRAPTVVLVGVLVSGAPSARVIDQLTDRLGGQAKDSQGRDMHGEGTLYIVDEWVRERVLLAEHIEAIRGGSQGGLRAWPACEWISVDPAGNSTNDQTGKSAIALMREAGLRVLAPRRSVEEGLNMLRARLLPADGSRGPTLFVHARCEQLLQSMQSYKYGEGAQRSTPQKDGSDHAVDALRYLVSGLDKKPAGVRGY
jgi:hypothetical protein